jgi:hypothetical protein
MRWRKPNPEGVAYNSRGQARAARDAPGMDQVKDYDPDRVAPSMSAFDPFRVGSFNIRFRGRRASRAAHGYCQQALRASGLQPIISSGTWDRRKYVQSCYGLISATEAPRVSNSSREANWFRFAITQPCTLRR